VRPGIRLTAAGRPDDLGDAEQLVERYAERLYRLATRITGSADDAEEIVADALGKAARTIHRFEDESALGSWLYRAAGREAHRRRARRQIAAALVVAPPAFDAEGHFAPLLDWSGRVDEASLLGNLRPAVAEALDELPADYRTALMLRDLEGASHQDIAEILGVDVPTARARVHRARLFVRQRLSELFDPNRAALGGGANPSP
jgi:RNA polymerase sigma-70 factor (ECF subfamily)